MGLEPPATRDLGDLEPVARILVRVLEPAADLVDLRARDLDELCDQVGGHRLLRDEDDRLDRAHGLCGDFDFHVHPS